ncbi:hypothetical protein C6P40_000591 [Pichia californica]|uniref:DUF1014-domain-containing protein n=1 Tax=Pichia californica TaxID=460514 RepID=A0A9P6WKG6_9ASCO|nr:hypothetical protein C6P42_000588 [[Candida] californica]KAG0688735.1 hypothetical protein C6P40_000591 [[Candida] californica]
MAKKGGKKGSEPVQQPDSDSDWDEGSKKPSKKQLEKEAKKQEQADKKKERDALLEMESSSIKTKKGGKTKSHKKDNGLDDALNQFTPKATINADGLDDSLAALTLLKKSAVSDKEIDRHPERRFKAALAEYTERRLPEVKKENPGLRKQQMEQLIYKEFQKSDENPFNQETNVSFNATAADISGKKSEIHEKRSKKYER